MLEQLLRAVRWRWPVILAVLIPASLIGVVMVQSSPRDATAVSVVGVLPTTESASSDMIQLTVQRYAVTLLSTGTLQKVSLQTKIPANVLSGAVTVAVAPMSGNMSISAQLASDQDALAVANAVGEQAVALGRADTLVDAEVLSAARLSAPPFTSSPRVLELVLILAALLAGIAVAYTLEVLRPRVRTGGDAADVCGAPVLGSLPDLMERWPRRGPVNDDEVLMSARGLRSGFTAAMRDLPRGGAVCFMAIGRGAGSTTIAFLLARSLSDRGERVVLIDADLEQPGLSQRLALPTGSGFDDVLADRAELSAAVHREGEVHVVGTRVVREAEDVLDRRLPDLLKNAADSYDIVLLDSAPVTTSTSAEIVAAHATSVVLVVGLGSLRADLELMMRRLQRLEIPVRGVVLNRATRSQAEASGAPDLAETGDD